MFNMDEWLQHYFFKLNYEKMVKSNIFLAILISHWILKITSKNYYIQKFEYIFNIFWKIKKNGRLKVSIEKVIIFFF